MPKETPVQEAVAEAVPKPSKNASYFSRIFGAWAAFVVLFARFWSEHGGVAGILEALGGSRRTAHRAVISIGLRIECRFLSDCVSSDVRPVAFSRNSQVILWPEYGFWRACFRRKAEKNGRNSQAQALPARLLKLCRKYRLVFEGAFLRCKRIAAFTHVDDTHDQSQVVTGRS